MSNIDNSKWQELIANLRPGQTKLAQWSQGKMAVAAVPGAGKSHSLAVAAALTIARQQLNPQRQLIIVTYTRSAAASIKTKVRDCLKQLGLAQWGFTVQTLHGLALSIASRHPDLHNLNLDIATLVNPTSNHRLLKLSVEKWLANNTELEEKLLAGLNFDGEETERLRRQSVLYTEVLPTLAETVIREAKSSGLTPENIYQISLPREDDYQILRIAAGLYEQYELLLRANNLIDYDDMILAALKVLQNQAIRQFWQEQTFAVFEDEAQDSSPLQESLISLLAANPDNHQTNLVRVGDPNQAINSTFTPADPVYFQWFCQDCQNNGNFASMNQGGRSTAIIIEAANYLLEWVNRRWLSQKKQSLESPFVVQKIEPVAPGDPQPEANPEPEGLGLEIYRPQDIEETVKLIGSRVIELFVANPGAKAAILVRENRQGNFVASRLNYLQSEYGIRVYEVGQMERQSQIPEEILKLLLFLDRPHSPAYLKGALEILQQRQLIATQDLNALATYPEQFLYPTVLSPPQKSTVLEARRYCTKILRAKLELPIYQLVPFLGMALKYTGSELATVEKLADRVIKGIFGQISLKNMINVLNDLVNSERFEPVNEENEDRYTRSGQLTIITMHKAKGLDWDYVFLPFLHEDSIPGDLRVQKSAQFLGDFNLEEVARTQLRTVIHSQYQGQLKQVPLPLAAWEEAKRLKEAEEYRLLYVAMTRAKRLLWMSAAKQGPYYWGLVRKDRPLSLQPKKPSPPLIALAEKFPHSQRS